MEKSYTVTKLTTSSPLYAASASFYREFTIENFFGEVLYVLTAEGEVHELQPYPHPSSVNRRVVLNVRTQRGYSTSGIRSDLPQVNAGSPKFPMERIEISSEQLLQDAIYVEELGLSISTYIHKERLKEVHRLHSGYYQNLVQNLISNYFNKGWPVPCVVLANTHNEKIEYLYVNINGNIASVKCTHDINEPEQISVTINTAEKHLIGIIDGEFEEAKLITDTISSGVWQFCTDREVLVKQIEKDKKEAASKLTAYEVSTKIHEATKDYERRISELTAENDQLKKELSSVKKDLALAQTEVERANSSTRFTMEQQMQMMRMNTAIAEQQAMQERKELIREQTVLKGQADAEVARAKIAKEQLAVQNAEMSNLGVFAKTAAVLAPIAVGASMWAKTALAAKGIGAAIAGASMTSVASAINPIAAGAALIGGASLFTSIGNNVCKAVSSIWNTVTSAIGSFWDWLTD